MEKHSFTLQVPQEVLDDLKERLTRIRWPDEAVTARCFVMQCGGVNAADGTYERLCSCE